MATIFKAPRRNGSSRPKPRLSCKNCRARKLKCDRKHPCSNCVKDSWDDCSYLPNGGLRGSCQSAVTESPRAQNQPARSKRRSDDSNLHLLFAKCDDGTMDDLHCLPVPQSTAKALLEIVENSAHVRWISLLIHWPTFKQEFDKYWLDPTSSTVSWLGLFYALLSIASHIVSHSKLVVEGLQSPAQISHHWMTKVARCLRISDYSKPTQYTVSTMILYLACEHNWTRDGHFQASLVLSLIVRVAFKLGYHRDPGRRSDKTLFQMEMQRRVWTFLKQLDHVIAQKCGLPRLIDDRKADTRLPLNILDDDLDPAMQFQPPICPDSLPTTIAVLNFKAGLLAIHGQIMDKDSAIEQMSYEQVLDLDQRLTAQAAMKPAWLALDSLTNSTTDDSENMSTRIETDLIIQSARMILHSRYLAAGRTDRRFALSREVCLNASRRSLNLQDLLFQSNGLYSDNLGMNWRLVALIGHNFLFAALLLCLDIRQNIETHLQSPSAGSHVAKAFGDHAEDLRLLSIAQHAWSKFGEQHSSGQEAAAMLGSLIEAFASSHQLTHENVRNQYTPSMSIQPPTNRLQDTGNVCHGLNRSHLLKDGAMSSTQIDRTFEAAHKFQLAKIGSQASQLGSASDDSLLQIQDMLDVSQIDFDWNTWTAELSNTDTGDDLYSVQWL